jgi:hypothetical protein
MAKRQKLVLTVQNTGQQEIFDSLVEWLEKKSDPKIKTPKIKTKELNERNP